MTNKDTKNYITLRQLHRSRRIWWIYSAQTLKKWVEKDMKGSNHLKTIKVGSGKASRYYFTSENIENYVRAFERADF